MRHTMTTAPRTRDLKAALRELDAAHAEVSSLGDGVAPSRLERALARLDEACRTPIASPWGEEEWDGVLERYWAEHEWIGIDQRARATSLCALNEAPTREDVLELAPAAAPSAAMRAQAARIEELSETMDDAPAGSLWLATQTLVDPEEDMDWRIVALVDVPASDEAGRVALATVTVAPR